MIRIGIICPSEIALRRFLPALTQTNNFKFVGIAVADKNEWENASEKTLCQEREKASLFVNKCGGHIFEGYNSLITSDEVDAIYLPLPPALHYKWAKNALLAQKHILVEKPATINGSDTQDLINIAIKNNLAVHENYMFVFHRQLQEIHDLIQQGRIGCVRQYRISFGFPLRAMSDFRYIKSLGGGALADCGGYTIKLTSCLLGKSAKLVYAKSNYINNFEVDMFGNAVMINDDGLSALLSFGMDNDYKCELEVWGNKGTLKTDRVLTAPPDFVPELQIKNNRDVEIVKLSKDDAFRKSIEHFATCIQNANARQQNYQAILRQARLIDEFKKLAKAHENE